METNFYWGDMNSRQVTVKEMFDALLDIEYLWIRGNYGQVGEHYRFSLLSELVHDVQDDY